MDFVPVPLFCYLSAPRRPLITKQRSRLAEWRRSGSRARPKMSLVHKSLLCATTSCKLLERSKKAPKEPQPGTPAKYHMDCPIWTFLPPSHRNTWRIRIARREMNKNSPSNKASLATYLSCWRFGAWESQGQATRWQSLNNRIRGCYVLLHLNLGREISKRPSRMPSRSAVLEKVCRASLQSIRLSTKLRHNLICPWTCLLGEGAGLLLAATPPQLPA
ncbi:hypothetical protein LY78DRAFT_300405 [Colletotrichum sublineola]|nr:hypothetical protein LY78DRAFT_300405 [Colletotrichum sublineola]